jgi:hypothetical protein
MMSPNFFLRTDQYAANLAPTIGSELADSFRAAARELVRRRLYHHGLEQIPTKSSDGKLFRLAKSNQEKRRSTKDGANRIGRGLRIG